VKVALFEREGGSLSSKYSVSGMAVFDKSTQPDSLLFI